jgi:hypothetical protein
VIEAANISRKQLELCVQDVVSRGARLGAHHTVIGKDVKIAAGIMVSFTDIEPNIARSFYTSGLWLKPINLQCLDIKEDS